MDISMGISIDISMGASMDTSMGISMDISIYWSSFCFHLRSILLEQNLSSEFV